MAALSSIFLPGEFHGTKEPGGLQSRESQVRHWIELYTMFSASGKDGTYLYCRVLV